MQWDHGNNVEEKIYSLNKKIREIDPSNIDFTIKKHVFFNSAKRYFLKIKQQEKNIECLIQNLSYENEILKRDNITLKIEINNIQEIIQKLEEEYKNGLEIKEKINKTIEKYKQENDETKAKFYSENILIPLEKKLFDMRQIILIKEQSCAAMEIIRRNNEEIIRNIDKIKNVTIIALNTAVLVAKSLYNQKLILNKINNLGKGNDNLIKGTSTILKKENDLFKSTSNNNSVDALKTAFKNVFETIDLVNEKNNKAFPENEIQIVELKKMEDSING